MRKQSPERGAYVREVAERTREYLTGMRAENETLRGLVAVLRAEKAHLDERLAAMTDLTSDLSRLHASIQQQTRQLAAQQEMLQTLQAEASRREGESARLAQPPGAPEVRDDFSERYVQLEQQTSTLSNLYVASYRLHETLDRGEVLAVIQEIIVNIVGSEELAVFELDEDGRHLVLSASTGIDPRAFARIPLGKGPVGRAAKAGEIVLGKPGKGGLTACIPLKLAGRLYGAIAIFRLLPQKPALQPVDSELFELLATHAAMALYCTRLHAQRKAG